MKKRSPADPGSLSGRPAPASPAPAGSWRQRAYYPFLFALFPALFLFTHNIEEVSLSVLPVPLAASLLLALLFWLPARLLLRDPQKAALLTFTFTFMFFSYGPILSGVFPKLVRKAVYAPLWAWGGLFLVAAVAIVRCRRSLKSLTALLNVFVAVLLVFSLVQIVIFQLQPDRSAGLPARDAAEDLNLARQSLVPRDRLPDIYYLIFDRYASGKNLQRFFGFDNSSFYSLLRKKGFYVADRSNCNHVRTHLSLSSSLNMDYAPVLLGKLPVQRRVVYRLMQDSRVLRLLKALGYTCVHFGSWYEPTKVNPFADVNYPGARQTDLIQDFTLKFLRSTALAPLRLSPYGHYESVRQKFRELLQVVGRPGPKFVFLHMLVPHSPFVFKANGEASRPGEPDPRSFEQKYTDQIRYLNRKIEELIDAILSRRGIPPVIIIQADEGPGPAEMPVDRLARLRDKRLPFFKTLIQYGILNAYLFPGKDKAIFHESISPVNSFRLLFNAYFGTRYELLPDISFEAKQTRTQILGFDVIPSSRFNPNREERRRADDGPEGPDGSTGQE